MLSSSASSSSSSSPSSSSSTSSSASSSPTSYSSSDLGVRLCFWLGSGVIGSPKPVLIIDPPAWQLPAKPLSTSCVPASAVSDSARERPSEIRLDGSSKSRKKSREGVWPLDRCCCCSFGKTVYASRKYNIESRERKKWRSRERENPERFLYIKYKYISNKSDRRVPLRADCSNNT